MTKALSSTQQAILEHAVHTTGGKITWFPEHIRGSARAKVLEGLLKRALITPGGGEWMVAAEGYGALGLPNPGVSPPATTLGDPELESYVARLEASWQRPTKSNPVRTRSDSEEAIVISLLQRPEGASIVQIMEATSWEQDTVRITLAGMLEKRLGLTITSSTEAGGQRVYRIEASATIAESETACSSP